jgi:hypothetical protein
MVYEEKAASVTTRKKIKDVVMDGNGHLIREYRTLFTLQLINVLSVLQEGQDFQSSCLEVWV